MNQDSRIKQRLELTRMIREENKSNRLRIRNRENILYGRSVSEPDSFEGYGTLINSSINPEKDPEHASSFGFRFLLSVFLFAVYFVCKTQNISFAGITSEQIEMAVAGENSITQIIPVTKIIDFIDQFPYTLHDS